MSEPEISSLTRSTPEDFLQLIREQERGKHKVYIGSSAGVGKTYQMLQEGNRLKLRGVDVVIGYVEPHERPETTAQIKDLEIIAPKVTNYRDVHLKEMDVEAVLRRHPKVALVDELAHSNVPGSKYAKRFEDVEELLQNGINVISTLNIQHLESLYNIVETATGVRVKERLPDAVLSQADQIINVDLAAEDLIDRLKSGRIYRADQIEQAMLHFFTPENLTKLREITLTEVAGFLDRKQRKHSTTKSEVSQVSKVMVAISSRGPHPESLLRKTARLATNLNGAWYVVYVRTAQEAPDKIPAETHRMLTDTLELAQKMGGTVIILKSDNVAEALIAFVHEYGITHVMMGKSSPRTFLQRLQPSIMEKLSAQLADVDLILS